VHPGKRGWDQILISKSASERVKREVQATLHFPLLVKRKSGQVDVYEVVRLKGSKVGLIIK
jgi:hypothetical protein